MVIARSLGEERYSCYKVHTMDRVKGFRTGRRAPRWSSVPHSHLPSSGFAHAYGRQWHRQHVLTSGGSADPGERLHLHLRTCSTPIYGQRLGAGVSRLWIPESNLFLLPAAEPRSWSLVLPEATVPC